MEDHEEPMTAAEIASLFGEAAPLEKVDPFPDENIYAIAGRVKNLATLAVNNNLTPMGTGLCNAYTHVLKALYEFSHTLSEEDRVRLKAVLKATEDMPANFIASMPAPEKPRESIIPYLDPRGVEKQYAETRMDPRLKWMLEDVEADIRRRENSAPTPPEPLDPPKSGFLHKIVNWFLT